MLVKTINLMAGWHLAKYLSSKSKIKRESDQVSVNELILNDALNHLLNHKRITGNDLRVAHILPYILESFQYSDRNSRLSLALMLISEVKSKPDYGKQFLSRALRMGGESAFICAREVLNCFYAAHGLTLDDTLVINPNFNTEELKFKALSWIGANGYWWAYLRDRNPEALNPIIYECENWFNQKKKVSLIDFLYKKRLEITKEVLDAKVCDWE